ncbi:MAG: transketolase [Gammaproteobacteria bacterium GWF2_41_13]|nr:MAG: transketolase [Gammaproteobacteria bacterium GWF2_41_13]
MLSRFELANAIRFLSIDAVQKANSGHPGMPMGMADIAEVLWNDFLKHNPNNPHWINRDRFVLSNGHGSMLQYSLLHLTGYDLSIDDLKQFRQLHSKTPGHPEVGMAPGIETTTGPLGQGLANAVGMALAEKMLAAHFNREGHEIIDHFTYAFAGDGCLMEGVSHEVCALAGTWKLGKLIVFWDDNKISIDGNVSDWFTDDTAKRFEAYHWHVIRNVNGHDSEAIKEAIIEARNSDRPTLICCNTAIGYGSPNKAKTASSHGSPLGAEEIVLTRQQLNWPYAAFEIPKEIYAAYDAKKKGDVFEKEWEARFAAYREVYPDLAKELLRRSVRQLTAGWEKLCQEIIEKALQNTDKMATRKASQVILNDLGPALPELLGGSADLTESNLTEWKGAQSFTEKNQDGCYIHYGVREFGMSAIMNGLALHGEFIPYGGTFLVFYTYAANAVRMAAIMKQRIIFVYSHDSIGLGEDGPTHQPVEQLAALRAVPNLSVWRPCDLVETAVAWISGIERKEGPMALILSRQTIPVQTHNASQIEQIKRGGYVIFDCENAPDRIIIAAGSEVGLAIEAAKQLNQRGKRVRVVSMPSIDTFERQDEAYRKTVLPPTVKKRVAIEAGASLPWYRWVGDEGVVMGLDRYGDSAPAEQVFAECGLTIDRIMHVVESLS